MYFLLALVLSACSFGAAEPTPTLELPTAVPASATPLPGLVILVAPEGASAVQEAAAAAGSYAAAHGLQFEQRAALTVEELPETTQVLVLLSPDPGVQALAMAAPHLRVITVGFAPAEPLPNVISLSLSSSAGSDDALFIAGYMAAVTANDWRTGILYTPAEAGLVDAYRAGAAYFCGACVPAGPPNSRYPVAAQANSAADWQAAADQLMVDFVRVVYLSPEMQASGAGQYLAGYGVTLMGSSAPAGELAPAWLATVSAQAGEGLESQLQQALAGQAPSQASGVLVEHVNTNLFSEARLQGVQMVIAELLSGVLSWQP